MIDIFDNISNKNKEKLLRKLEAYTFNFKKNSSILKVINSGNMVGTIIYGTITLIRSDDNGNQNTMDTFYTGDVFNYNLSLLDTNDYEFIAKEDSCVVLIEYERIITSYNNELYFRQFIKNLLKIVFAKINIQNEKIEILTKKTIRNKLLEFKIMSRKSGSKIIYIPVSFNELADYLAIDRTAMSRELKNLQDEKLIKKDNKKITILY